MEPSSQDVPDGLVTHNTPYPASDPSDKTLAVAQRLNYDILSTIFIIAASKKKTAALKMCRMCRLWRHVALSTPRIWSEIDLDESITPYRLSLYLERSSPLPFNIRVASEWVSRVLSSVMGGIVRMTIGEHQGIMPHRYNVYDDSVPFGLRRVQFLPCARVNAFQDLSKASQPPQLREICISNLPVESFYKIAPLHDGFSVLQMLKITCEYFSDWHDMIRGASNTLVSLSLCIWFGPTNPIPQFSFPQLRHLRMTKGGDDPSRLVLDLDAPLLESVEQGFGVGKKDDIEIRLQDPKSVKQLHFECDPLDLTPYPALRKLWITGKESHNDAMLKSLGSHIASCPELETILYCHPRGRAESGEDPSFGPSSVFLGILDLVRETGRDITVREFLPDELDLPGAMR